MGTVLADIGGRYAERWVSMLVLPGLLYVLGATAAIRLGHQHWSELERLQGLVPAGRPNSPAWVLLFIALPVLASAAGLAARGVGSLLERLWCERWPLNHLNGWRTGTRAARWRAAQHAYEESRGTRPVGFAALEQRALTEAPDPADQIASRSDALALARNRIALVPPTRPTWMGDRLAAAGTRVRNWYGLDLAFAWPRLWLVLSESEQTTLRAARARLDAATTLAGWGLLCLPLAIWWSPAAVVGLVLFTIGLRRGRTAVDVLAHLVEAVVDLKGRTLAESLGFRAPEGPLAPDLGKRITAHLRKAA